MNLTNSYCEGIEKSLTHHQHQCATCGLWTQFVNRKTGEHHSECKCELREVGQEMEEKA